jgi:hypothetical protein
MHQQAMITILVKQGPKKVFFCKRQGSKGVPWNPRNLQIIPDSSAEIVVEEQMPPIFKHSFMTENAIMVLSNIPVPPQEHVLHIDSFMKD